MGNRLMVALGLGLALAATTACGDDEGGGGTPQGDAALWQVRFPRIANFDDFDPLAADVYQELRRLAAAYVRRERHKSVQATELVHEAWIRLSAGDHPFKSRGHFYAVAALQMRHLLIDLVRMAASGKRQGQAVTITVSLVDPSPRPEDLQQVAEAFERLSEMDERKAQAFALNELLGFTIPECAEILETSTATLQRDLRFARSWLASRIAT